MPFDEGDLERFGDAVRREVPRYTGDRRELERRVQLHRRRQLAGIGVLVTVFMGAAVFTISRRPAADREMTVADAGASTTFPAAGPSTTPSTWRGCPSRANGSSWSSAPSSPSSCCPPGAALGAEGQLRSAGAYKVEYHAVPSGYGDPGCHAYAEVIGTATSPATSIGFVTIHRAEASRPTSRRDLDARLLGADLIESPVDTPTIDVRGAEATVVAYVPPSGAGSTAATNVIFLDAPGATIVMDGDRIDWMIEFLRSSVRSELLGA